MLFDSRGLICIRRHLILLHFDIQGYLVVPSDKRFLVLFTFLKKNREKKVMVFFSSCHSVKYHSELLNYIDLEVLDIHVCIILQYFCLTCCVAIDEICCLMFYGSLE